MNEPTSERQPSGRRRTGPSIPVATGAPSETREVHTGGSIDCTGGTSYPADESQPGKTISIPGPLHQELKIEASRCGLKLKEFIEPALRALLPASSPESMEALLGRQEGRKEATV